MESQSYAASVDASEGDPDAQSNEHTQGIQKASPLCVIARDASNAPVEQMNGRTSYKHEGGAYRIWERDRSCLTIHFEDWDLTA
jgi:hypothetical protein